MVRTFVFRNRRDAPLHVTEEIWESPFAFSVPQQMVRALLPRLERDLREWRAREDDLRAIADETTLTKKGILEVLLLVLVLLLHD